MPSLRVSLLRSAALALLTASAALAAPYQTAAFRSAITDAHAKWLATHPSTAFLTAGNDLSYAFGYLEETPLTDNSVASASTYLGFALEKEAHNGFARYLLGLSEYGLGRRDAAQRDLQAAAAQQPELAEAAMAWAALASVPDAPAPVVKPMPAPASPTAGRPAPKPAAAPTPAAVRTFPAALAVAKYDCFASVKDSFASTSSTRHVEARGQMNILSGSRYQIGSGTYRYTYTPRNGLITWVDGPLAGAKPADSDYSLDQKRQPTIAIFINSEQRFCTAYR